MPVYSLVKASLDKDKPKNIKQPIQYQPKVYTGTNFGTFSLDKTVLFVLAECFVVSQSWHRALSTCQYSSALAPSALTIEQRPVLVNRRQFEDHRVKGVFCFDVQCFSFLTVLGQVSLQFSYMNGKHKVGKNWRHHYKQSIEVLLVLVCNNCNS